MQVGELWAKLTLSDKDFRKNLKSADKGFGSFVDSITSNAATIGTVVGAIATGALTKLGIELNASLEQARIGFTTMLGSAEKADVFLKQLADFAKNTPFEFAGLRSTAQTMMALGFQAKDVIPVLTSVGDAVAAMGKGQDSIDRILAQMGQMKTTGRATWEDIKVMSENGISALEYLSAGLGKSVSDVRDMMKDGALDANTAIKLITEGMNKDFGGMMKKMETTWNGMTSNIKDGAMFLLGSAFQPIFTSLRDKVLPVVKDTVAALQQNFDSGGGLAGALKILVPSGLADDLKKVSDFIGDLKTKLQNNDWEGAGKALGEGLKTMVNGVVGLGQKLADKVITEAKSVNWAQVGKSSTEFALNFVLGFIGGLLDPAVWIAVVKENWGLILEIVLGLMLAPEKWALKIGALLAKIPFVGKVIEKIVKWLAELGTKIKDPVFQFFKDMGKFFMDGLDDGLKIGPSKIIATVKKMADDAINAVKDFGLKWFDKGGTWMKELGRGIGEKVTAIVEKGRNIVEGLWKGISEKGGWLADKIKNFVNDNVVQPVKTFLDIQSPSKVMAEFGKYVAEGLAQGIEENKGKVANKAMLLAEAITGALDKVSTGLNLTGDIAQAKFDLFSAKMGETATESEKYKAKLELLNAQMVAQNDTVAVLQKAYNEMVKVKGAAADESQKLYLKLLQEQKAQAGLRAEIIATNNAQAGSRKGWTAADYITEAAQKAWDAGDTGKASDYLNMIINDSGPVVGSDEYAAAHPDMPDWLGGGKITALAAGGIVTRPTLAMVGEGGESEAVVPLSKLGDMGGGEQTIIIQLDGRTIAKQTVQYMPGILRLAGVKI